MKTKRAVSLKDLAKELGVSISTVSRALKNSSEIGEDTKMKIRALAKERGYRPNPFAMSLLKNTPRIIGILVPDIVTHFYSSIISGISAVARRNGYSTIVSSSFEEYAKEKECIEDLVNIRVEGIIACLTQETTDFAHFEELYHQNIPLVLFDRVCLSDKISSVVTNNIASAKLATMHLLETGSKRVAFLGGSNNLQIVKERKHGYLEALRQYKMLIERELVCCDEIGYEAGYKGGIELLSQSNPPDAILGMTDSLTFGAMKAIYEKGLRIPDDIAVVGYTDELHCDYTNPPLTGMTHQTYKMGEVACDLLLKQLKGDSQVFQETIPCVLEVRGSSFKIKTP